MKKLKYHLSLIDMNFHQMRMSLKVTLQYQLVSLHKFFSELRS